MVGVATATGIIAFARIVGFDRDRSFYPTVLIVTASYYVLFAVMESDHQTLAAEAAVMAVFVGAAVLGFKFADWIIAGAFVAHGVLDVIHSLVIPNPAGPGWWPMFCLSLDVVVAVFLAARLLQVRSTRS